MMNYKSPKLVKSQSIPKTTSKLGITQKYDLFYDTTITNELEVVAVDVYRISNTSFLLTPHPDGSWYILENAWDYPVEKEIVNLIQSGMAPHLAFEIVSL